VIIALNTNIANENAYCHTSDFHDDYQRQMDIYSWPLKQKGYEVYPEAFFVFYQVKKEGETAFNGALKFREEVRSVKVNTDWVGDAFEAAVAVARADAPPELPPRDNHCDHCHYVKLASDGKVNPDVNL